VLAGRVCDAGTMSTEPGVAGYRPAMTMERALPHQGVVLAAGEGRRLRPLTESTPKALIHFCGRPLLDHAVAHLVEAGVRRLAVNACYLGDQVARHVEEVLAAAWPEVAFHVSRETTLLGTGGALKALEGWLEDGPFWVANADNVYAEPLASVWRHHVASGADGTLMVTRDPAHRTLRRLVVDDEGWVRGIVEPWAEEATVFCGVQVAEASLVERLPAGPSCSLRQGYLPYLAGGAVRVATCTTTGFWADTGTVERLSAAEREGARWGAAVVTARTPSSERSSRDDV